MVGTEIEREQYKSDLEDKNKEYDEKNLEYEDKVKECDERGNFLLIYKTKYNKTFYRHDYRKFTKCKLEYLHDKFLAAYNHI